MLHWHANLKACVYRFLKKCDSLKNMILFLLREIRFGTHSSELGVAYNICWINAYMSISMNLPGL